MQEVQRELAFLIETPSNAELYERFNMTGDAPTSAYVPPKKRNRKGNKQKRLERIERDA